MSLDPILHQPVRTQIIALLLREGRADYNSIKQELQLTDGHMSTHMRGLSEAGYIEVKKEFVGNKPKTTYKISPLGKKRLQEYIKELKSLIML